MDDTKNVEIDNNKKINNSEVLNTNHNTYNYDNRDEIYQDFTISDISLEGDSETSLATFKAKITNVGSSDINRLYCMLYFYDNDDNVLYSFEYVEDEFKINETRDINFFAQTDFSNAKDFKLACKNLE